MTDEEIRALVRDAITRHLGHSTASVEHSAASGGHATASGGNPFRGAEVASPAPGQPAAAPPWRAHPSFGRFLVTSGTEEGGPCLIEPNVRCNHCGYCQSYGH